MDLKMEDLDRPTQRLIAEIKPTLRTFAQRFGQVQESRAELAPQFMKIYNQIAAAHDGFTFVEYVRLLDPTVPTAAAGDDGYRNHKLYQACDYLRRLTRLRPRGRQGVRDNATDMLARSLATMLTIIRDPNQVWSALQTEFQFTERALTNLKRRVETTRPLFQLPIARPVQIGNVIHMPRANAPAAPAEPVAANGRRRRRAA